MSCAIAALFSAAPRSSASSSSTGTISSPPSRRGSCPSAGCERGQALEVAEVLRGERDHRPAPGRGTRRPGPGTRASRRSMTISQSQTCSSSLRMCEETSTVRSPSAELEDELAHLVDARPGRGRWWARPGRAAPGRRGARRRCPGAASSRTSTRRTGPSRAPSSPTSVEHLRDAARVVAAERRPARGGSRTPVRPGQNAGVSISAPTRPRYAAGSSRLAPSTVAAAGRRAHEPEQHRHRRRLAGAVRADEARDDTGRNLDAERVDGRTAAVPLRQVVGDECGCGLFGVHAATVGRGDRASETPRRRNSTSSRGGTRDPPGAGLGRRLPIATLGSK